MNPRPSCKARQTGFLIALVISATALTESVCAQRSTPDPVTVPEAVAIARPSADDIDVAQRGLKEFIAGADAETKAILEKYPALLEVRPPRANTAIVPNLAPFFRRKHEANLEVAKQGDAEVLFMGDSITDFWRNESGAFAGKAVFDQHFGNWKVANFGIAGDTTQGVLYRLQNGEGEGFDPKAVMLMIGTNNTRRNSAVEIAEGIGAVVHELQSRFANSKILLLAVFPRGRSNDPVRATIDEINRTIARLHDGQRVHYLDIGAKFLDDDGNIPRQVMSDSLHPSASGYEIWAQAVKEPLAKLIESADDAGPKANVVPENDPVASTKTLKAAVGDRFKVGVGVGHRVVQIPENAELIRQHFQIITPENCMKPQGIHPAEDRWNFAATDRFVDFARANHFEVVGHCLVWAKDDRTDQWMMNENGKPVSRETLLRRIETHIETVVDRYGDAVTMWDVVNEAIGDSNEGLLRDSVYSRTTGIDFIVAAFKTARAKDPDALLIYNDYNGHKPGKREKLIELLTKLKAMGAPVDAYGMQGHFELGDDSTTQLRETFDALRKLGLKVVVSELDIDVVTRGRWWADGGKYREELSGYDPYKDGVPADIESQQTEQYVELFKLFAEYSDIIERVSFWNLHDGQSWLNGFPWRRVNYPLLFNRSRKPKSAFDAVFKSLTSNMPSVSRSSHEARPRNDENSRIAHEQLLAKTKQGQIDIYFQGDSITRRWGATDYPKLLTHWKKHFHGLNAANFAWGGDNTHNILWRMRNGELDGVSPKLIVLQAGTNNLPWRGPANDATVGEVVQGTKAILDEFQSRVPSATIILTALFPRPQNLALAPTIDQINERIKTLADGRRIRFLNINDQLTDSSGRLRPGVSSDGLHLEQPGYEIWAEALKPILEELLGPPAPEDHAPPPTGNPAAAR